MTTNGTIAEAEVVAAAQERHLSASDLAMFQQVYRDQQRIPLLQKEIERIIGAGQFVTNHLKQTYAIDENETVDLQTGRILSAPAEVAAGEA